MSLGLLNSVLELYLSPGKDVKCFESAKDKGTKKLRGRQSVFSPAFSSRKKKTRLRL